MTVIIITIVLLEAIDVVGYITTCERKKKFFSWNKRFIPFAWMFYREGK